MLPGVFGVLIQCALFLCVVSTLALKKCREDQLKIGAVRTWQEFLLDSSKQIIGAGWIHVLNLCCALILGDHFGGDQCEWYWVNLMLDTTLGVAINYTLLLASTAALDACLGPSAKSFHTGQYRVRGQLQPDRFIKQLSVWLCIITCMKAFMLLLMFLLSKPLQTVASVVLKRFADTPTLKLVVVMIITPLFMNAFQFWVTDTFIKKSKDPVEEPLTAEETSSPSTAGGSPVGA